MKNENRTRPDLTASRLIFILKKNKHIVVLLHIIIIAYLSFVYVVLGLILLRFGPKTYGWKLN